VVVASLLANGEAQMTHLPRNGGVRSARGVVTRGKPWNKKQTSSGTTRGGWRQNGQKFLMVKQGDPAPRGVWNGDVAALTDGPHPKASAPDDAVEPVRDKNVVKNRSRKSERP
jgi:hypothetical protein